MPNYPQRVVSRPAGSDKTPDVVLCAKVGDSIIGVGQGCLFSSGKLSQIISCKHVWYAGEITHVQSGGKVLPLKIEQVVLSKAQDVVVIIVKQNLGSVLGIPNPKMVSAARPLPGNSVLLGRVSASGEVTYKQGAVAQANNRGELWYAVDTVKSMSGTPICMTAGRGVSVMGMHVGHDTNVGLNYGIVPWIGYLIVAHSFKRRGEEVPSCLHHYNMSIEAYRSLKKTPGLSLEASSDTTVGSTGPGDRFDEMIEAVSYSVEGQKYLRAAAFAEWMDDNGDLLEREEKQRLEEKLEELLHQGIVAPSTAASLAAARAAGIGGVSYECLSVDSPIALESATAPKVVGRVSYFGRGGSDRPMPSTCARLVEQLPQLAGLLSEYCGPDLSPERIARVYSKHCEIRSECSLPQGFSKAMNDRIVSTYRLLLRHPFSESFPDPGPVPASLRSAASYYVKNQGKTRRSLGCPVRNSIDECFQPVDQPDKWPITEALLRLEEYLDRDLRCWELLGADLHASLRKWARSTPQEKHEFLTAMAQELPADLLPFGCAMGKDEPLKASKKAALRDRIVYAPSMLIRILQVCIGRRLLRRYLASSADGDLSGKLGSYPASSLGLEDSMLREMVRRVTPRADGIYRVVAFDAKNADLTASHESNAHFWAFAFDDICGLSQRRTAPGKRWARAAFLCFLSSCNTYVVLPGSGDVILPPADALCQGLASGALNTNIGHTIALKEAAVSVNALMGLGNGDDMVLVFPRTVDPDRCAAELSRVSGYRLEVGDLASVVVKDGAGTFEGIVEFNSRDLVTGGPLNPQRIIIKTVYKEYSVDIEIGIEQALRLLHLSPVINPPISWTTLRAALARAGWGPDTLQRQRVTDPFDESEC